jgi:membrane protease YdiL (CAAX protease family)
MAGPGATPATTRHPLVVDAAAIVLVLGYGAAVNELIPHAAYVPANLAAAGIAIAAARRLGVTWAGLGLGRDKLLSGLGWGSATVFPLVFGVAIAVALPATRGFFYDQAVTGLTLTQALYEVLVRIPFGTALAEEALFRGALLGLFLQHHRPRTAVILSSLAFGLWHVLPTLHSLTTNQAAAEAATSTPSKVGIVVGTVAFTAVAGLAFCWLRRRSGSLLAPWMAHTAINTLAFTGARVAGKG